MYDKNELRRQIRQGKLKMSDAVRLEKSAAIMRLLEEHVDFKRAKTVVFYWSMPDEVHTHDFINKWWKTKTVLLPSVQGDYLTLKQFTGMQSLKVGESIGILEPDSTELLTDTPVDLIVVPGMAFDKKNYRLGRGRGFYDRLLLNNPSKKIGICFDFQLFESIPTEIHDIPMDTVIWG